MARDRLPLVHSAGTARFSGVVQTVEAPGASTRPYAFLTAPEDDARTGSQRAQSFHQSTQIAPMSMGSRIHQKMPCHDMIQ